MPDALYKVERFGREKEPVVVIDDFSGEAESLLRDALAANYGPGGRHYPGMRAPAPAQYLRARADLLTEIIGQVFGASRGADLLECNFSVVTTPPGKLTPIQRFPHFDGTDPVRLALLHYLCPPEAGGTSFYRHRATQFETITQDRLQRYDTALRSDVQRLGMPEPQYFHGSDGIFECIGSIPARFDRLVIYRGVKLHSGDILQPEWIGAGLSKARITINTFLSVRS